jgi:formylmethanofuran dehydrogenase subunit E
LTGEERHFRQTSLNFDYAALLGESGRFHGDICTGIAIGTRMAISGLHRVGIADPKGTDRKSLMVFVELDRGTTDAIMAITGCRPGKRTMKVLDYGKMAATFINLKTGQAVAPLHLRALRRNGDGWPGCRTPGKNLVQTLLHAE